MKRFWKLGILVLVVIVTVAAYVRPNSDVTFGTISGSTITATTAFSGGTIAGTDITVTGLVITNGTSALSGAGVVPITEPMAELTSTSTDAWTLADGAEGQHVFIVMIVDGGTAVLTPANAGGWTTLTFADAGDSAHLLFTNGNWYLVGQGGLTTGPLTA